MSVSDRDRQRVAAQARDLASVERETAPDDQALRRAIAVANRARALAGVALIDERVEPSEVEFYRRARALGFRQIGR